MKPNVITVQQETKVDRKFVFEVHKLAFKREEEAILVDRLRISPAYIPALSLVAIIEDHIVGHILFTEIKIDKRDVHALALAPISVLPAFQNQGIGGLLIREGLSKAAETGYGAVIVLGHEHYYPKFGFVPASKWHITAPFDVPDNFFMGMELFPGALDGVSGEVEYAPEFY
ncbi:GNAT family N-acetyltransferase [Chitinophaga sp. SYP-B3965]|uniref:GNAT family N-acetyltransferase n=1 Tax=Chitinophaga sp. SYP-B3965 TaxID=2663120 RepID=UPI001299E814|nr:N-acetyltransferase [Chitinophaga sp. SYP-B3965]MRG44831.1 GNAT family N-acetyltransferase [Chitinophaga sp. SYP-B3965]